MAFKIGDKYFHEDIESGEIVEISETTYNEMMAWRKRVESMISPNNKVKGTIQVFSTTADNGSDSNFREFWNNFKK